MTNARRKLIKSSLIPSHLFLVTKLILTSLLVCLVLSSCAPSYTPTAELPLTDSFTLDVFDMEELESKYRVETGEFSPQLPFNDCGLYQSKQFFLAANETVDLNISSDYPISARWIESSKDYPISLQLYNLFELEGEDAVRDLTPISYEHKRAGNVWETSVAFETRYTGFYYFIFWNSIGGLPCSIQYIASVRQGS